MAEPNDKELRGPVNLRIKFRSASLQQFIERYGVDVSRGGIFIRTREPLPVGTRLKLDFQLVDAAPLFQGDGTVVWIREYDPGKTGVTPGMGVRFDRLTPESQPTLDKILDEKMRLQQTGRRARRGSQGGRGPGGAPAFGVITALDALAPEVPSSAPARGRRGQDGCACRERASVGAAPATTMPASQSRSGPVATSGGGIFSRPRTTGGLSTLRSRACPVGAVRGAHGRRHRQGAAGAGREGTDAVDAGPAAAAAAGISSRPPPSATTSRRRCSTSRRKNSR